MHSLSRAQSEQVLRRPTTSAGLFEPAGYSEASSFENDIDKADKDLRKLRASINDLHDKIQFLKIDSKTNQADKSILLNKYIGTIERLERENQDILDRQQLISKFGGKSPSSPTISINIHNYFSNATEEDEKRSSKKYVDVRAFDEDDLDMRSVTSDEDTPRNSSVIIINKIVHVHNSPNSPNSQASPASPTGKDHDSISSPQRQKSFIQSATDDIKNLLPSGRLSIRVIKRGKKDSFRFKPTEKKFETPEEEIQHLRTKLYKLKQHKHSEDFKKQIEELTDKLRILTGKATQ